MAKEQPKFIVDDPTLTVAPERTNPTRPIEDIEDKAPPEPIFTIQTDAGPVDVFGDYDITITDGKDVGGTTYKYFLTVSEETNGEIITTHYGLDTETGNYVDIQAPPESYSDLPLSSSPDELWIVVGGYLNHVSTSIFKFRSFLDAVVSLNSGIKADRDDAELIMQLRDDLYEKIYSILDDYKKGDPYPKSIDTILQLTPTTTVPQPTDAESPRMKT